jgi:uncharacterized protein (DUF58 family)
MSDFLLDPKELRLLEGLRLNPRRAFPGRVRGERLTRRKGISIDFADYRDYAEGDDLRHLDWNVLARLDAPIMKTYQDEEDLAVHVLLDASDSMSFGEPSKLEGARRLACAMGYVALSGGDAVYGRLLGRTAPPLPALRGRAGFVRLAAWAAAAHAEGKALATGLKAFAASGARPGLVVLVSDGMDPDAAAGLRAVGGRGHELLFLQVLSDVELEPDLEGDLRLLDSETNEFVEITANSITLREYRRRLDAHLEGLKAAVLRSGGRHALVRPDQSLEELLRGALRREGWFAA